MSVNLSKRLNIQKSNSSESVICPSGSRGRVRTLVAQWWSRLQGDSCILSGRGAGGSWQLIKQEPHAFLCTGPCKLCGWTCCSSSFSWLSSLLEVRMPSHRRTGTSQTSRSPHVCSQTKYHSFIAGFASTGHGHTGAGQEKWLQGQLGSVSWDHPSDPARSSGLLTSSKPSDFRINVRLLKGDVSSRFEKHKSKETFY